MNEISNPAHIPRVVDPEAARELHEFARQLGESISNELSAHIDPILLNESLGGLRTQVDVRDFFPQILEKHFLRGLLGDKKAARNRARLVHALSALSLQSLDDDNPLPGIEPQALVARPEADEVLTSAETAKLLNVSRTYVNTLVETGKLGAVERTEGGHRRILKSVVLTYKADSLRKQEQALNEMLQASEELGLYDDELEGLPRQDD